MRFALETRAANALDAAARRIETLSAKATAQPASAG